jgi:DNA invertase Pin-like site-specific DNA recombinase
VSLDLQEGRLRAYAEAKDWSLVQVVSEDASAKSLNRSGLQQVLSLIKAGEVDALQVYKLDRLTRSVLSVASAGGLCVFVAARSMGSHL